MKAFIKALTTAGKIFQVGSRVANTIIGSGGNTVPRTPYVPPFVNRR